MQDALQITYEEINKENATEQFGAADYLWKASLLPKTSQPNLLDFNLLGDNLFTKENIQENVQ